MEQRVGMEARTCSAAYGRHSIHGTEGRAKAAPASLLSGVNSDRGRGLIQFYTRSTVCQAGHGGTAIGKKPCWLEAKPTCKT